MKIARGIIFCSILTASAFAQDPSPSPSPEPPPSAALRVNLSDLGGALSNEGFKMRDRIWSGNIEAGQPQRLAVNLFRGNQYWFCAAVDPKIKSAKVSVFGPDGQPLEMAEHSGAGLAAAGVTAGATGQYFVQVETSSGSSSDFCLLYLFK